MPKIKTIFAFIGIILISNTEGKELIFSESSNGIFVYDFDEDSVNLIYDSKKKYVNSVSPFSKHKLIFSESSILGNSAIYILDLKNFSKKYIGKGLYPFILQDKLFYFIYDSKNKQQNLHYSILNKTLELNQEKMVQKGIMPDRVVNTPLGFYYVNNETSRLFFFKSSDLTSLSLKGHYIPMLYSNELNGLIVFDRLNHIYKKVFYDQKRNVLISDFFSFFNIGSPRIVTDGDDIFFQKRVSSWIIMERNHIYKMNLKTGKQTIIIPNKKMLSGYIKK